MGRCGLDPSGPGQGQWWAVVNEHSNEILGSIKGTGSFLTS